MNLGKKFLEVAIIVSLVLAVFAPITLQAETASNNSITLAIDDFRGQDSDGNYISYALPKQRCYKVYEINNETPNYDKAIFCLDAGRGFGSDTGNINSELNHGKEYNLSKNMLNTTDESVIKGYETANNSSFTEDDYAKIVRILKSTYIPGVTSKKDFLDNIFGVDGQITKDEGEEGEGYRYSFDNGSGTKVEYYITDKDIEIAEQLAIWHYTNENTETAGNTFGTYLGEDEISNLYTAIYSDEEKNTLSDLIEQCMGDGSSGIYYDNDLYTATGYKFYNLSEIVGGYSELHVQEDINDTQMVADEYRGMWNRFKGINEIYNNFLTIAESTEEISNSGVSITYWTDSSNISTTQPVAIVEKTTFDLALRKFITKIDGNEVESREPQITAEEKAKLNNKEGKFDGGTTAEKTHSKEPLKVEKGNTVTYTIRIYNEGKTDGTATEVTDYLPEGLTLAPYTEGDGSINDVYGWKADSTNPRVIKTEYLKEKTIEAFKGTELKYEDLQIECIVNENATSNNLKNIAEITEDTGDDIDSTPNNVHKDNYTPEDGSHGKGEEDDDDYEDLYIEEPEEKEIDIALRKFISGVNDVVYNREPTVYVSNLIPNGTDKTARYVHSKTPLSVKIGDIVTYTIRVYNEGEVDAYVGEVKDYLPEELTFISDATSTDEAIIEATEFNAGYGWTRVDTTGKISTDVLSKNTTNTSLQSVICNEQNRTSALLKAFDGNKLDYIDLKVKCLVNENSDMGEKITNIAEITKYEDENGSELEKDRDSEPANFPEDKKNNEYEGNGNSNGYWPGQQDDDDFERVIIQQFDLALRKFISDIDGKETSLREPNPDVSKLNKKDENGKLITTAEYNHIKQPITAIKGSVVTYTIRVYNEGNIDGYVNEITDYLPPELEYIENSEINTLYGWKPSDDGRTVTTNYLKYTSGSTENLLKAFDEDKQEISYKEVKIQCKVKDTAEYQKNITNLAQITDDCDSLGEDVEDRDSVPNDNFELPKDEDLPKYKDDELSKAYIPGQEDDDDFEKINVVYFDLALRKIVSKAILIESENQTVTQTNHKFEDDPEGIVKVDLGRKNLKNVTVKFEYQIRITNEGLISGYAKEVKDYIPEGLEFKVEDNPLWKEDSSGVITTDQLKDTLLKPGDSKIVSVLLTWKNDQSNLGLKTNVAEISKDYNEYNAPDIDSTPDNKKDGEDDIDDAPVMLSIALGAAQTYAGLALLISSTFGIGVYLIKKFVL